MINKLMSQGFLDSFHRYRQFILSSDRSIIIIDIINYIFSDDMYRNDQL
jgi:hypothetical protein